MDGVSDAKQIIKQAYEWGHKAIAIPDHGVVQAFPEANHCFDEWGGVVPKDADFKVIYGMEAYLVDDLKGIVQNSKGQPLRGKYVVFDIETNGFSAMAASMTVWWQGQKPLIPCFQSLLNFARAQLWLPTMRNLI